MSPAWTAPLGKCGWAWHRNVIDPSALALEDTVRGRERWVDLGDEGGLFCGDACLCGAVVDFFGELGGRGFGLDDSGGCFVAATRE